MWQKISIDLCPSPRKEIEQAIESRNFKTFLLEQVSTWIEETNQKSKD